MDYHNIYNQLITKRLNLCPVGYSEKQTGYPYSQDAVTKQFAKYVSSFVPQNGKIRGNRKKRKTIKGL